MFLAAGAGYAQQRPLRDSLFKTRVKWQVPMHVVIKTSPLAMIAWQLTLTGEYRLVGELMTGRIHSFQLGASYLVKREFFDYHEMSKPANYEIAGKGFRIQGAYRIYLHNDDFWPEGFYLSILGSYAYMRFNYEDYPNNFQSLRHFNINALFGQQILIADRVSMELFMGIGYKNNCYVSHSEPEYEVLDFEHIDDDLMTPFKTIVGTNIGVAL